MKLLRTFNHPDHLGSSSWITDNSGNAIQHLHYLPFGEDWVDQRNSSWNAPYTFSGKEKDTETGYGYYGARYYDSGLSIWLSVDPMSDKYPSMSPYNYCANNPVILVDPDGRDVYTVDIKGVIKKVEGETTDEGIDVLYFVDSDGIRGESITVKSGILQGLINKDDHNNYETQSNGNRQQMENLYGFMQRNTDVEWVLYGCGEGEFSVDFLATSRSKEEVFEGGSSTEALKKGGMLDYHRHSHSWFVFDAKNCSQSDYEDKTNIDCYGGIVSDKDLKFEKSNPTTKMYLDFQGQKIPFKETVNYKNMRNYIKMEIGKTTIKM
jgi:RHS repeat-associated protein